MSTVARFLVVFTLFIAAATLAVAQKAGSTGNVIVRVDDTSGSHCINASTESIDLHLRRVFVHKNVGIFTEDKRAGVLVRTGLAANADTKVQIPSVNMVSIESDDKGQVSLALEYSVASGFQLNQQNTLTRNLELTMNLAKAKGRNTFGEMLDIAGQALNAAEVPANPYAMAASKFLKFANDAVDKSISKDGDEQIARVALKFNTSAEPNLQRCSSAGNERTGAIAVLRSVGKDGTQLIPVKDTEKLYCFSYSSANTYELLAARRNTNGSCPAQSEFVAVPNDYVMFLLSANPTPAAQRGMTKASADKYRDESLARCRNFKLPVRYCGVSE